MAPATIQPQRTPGQENSTATHIPFLGTQPSSTTCPILVGAVLGKKIEFRSLDKHDDVVKRITDVYPRLAKYRGVTLHKPQDQTSLTKNIYKTPSENTQCIPYTLFGIQAVHISLN